MQKPPHADLQHFLDRLLLRSALSQEERDAILDLPGEMKLVRANLDIVQEGEVVDHACLVVEGLLGRFQDLSDGRREITALHIPGDMPDLLAVPLPRVPFGITAICASKIIRVRRSALLEAATHHAGIAVAFMRDAAVDASILSTWVTNTGRRSAIERVAHLLCEMNVRLHAIGRGAANRFTMPCTQVHLADATGLTSVHVNRTLQTLKRRGLVSVSGHTFEILDWDVLKQIADFQPSYLHRPTDSKENPCGEWPLRTNEAKGAACQSGWGTIV